MADKSKDILFGTNATGSIGAEAMRITDCSLKAEHEWYEPDASAMIGTQKPANAGRQVVKTDVKGGVTVQPSYANADTLLGLCFDETTGTFTPADSPEGIGIDVVMSRGFDVTTYADCFLNSLEISGNPNEPVSWVMDLLGKTAADAGTVSALTVPDVMLFSDFTFSINSNAYFPTNMVWKFDYAIDERFHNSVTRSSVMSNVPMCTLDLEFDVNSDTWADLFNKSGTDTAIDNVVLTATDGTHTMTITMPEMTNINPSPVPDMSGVDAIKHTLNLRAWLDSEASDIVTITYA